MFGRVEGLCEQGGIRIRMIEKAERIFHPQDASDGFIQHLLGGVKTAAKVIPSDCSDEAVVISPIAVAMLGILFERYILRAFPLVVAAALVIRRERDRLLVVAFGAAGLLARRSRMSVKLKRCGAVR